MKRFINPKLGLAGLAAITAVILTSGIAFAYWTSTGSGAGSAGTKTAITVTLTGNAVSNLVPGAPQSITGTVTVSDSATSAYIGTVTPVIKTGTGFTTFNTGCTASDFTLTPAVVNAQTSAGATGVAFGSIVLTDTAANQDGCKGQALVLAFSSN